MFFSVLVCQKARNSVGGVPSVLFSRKPPNDICILKSQELRWRRSLRGFFCSIKPQTNNVRKSSKTVNTYKHILFEKHAHRDLANFAPSLVQRATLWTRFGKNMFQTILCYSVLFRTIPYYVW